MANFDLKRIQDIINKLNVDGWLLYDFRGSNDLAHTILDIPKGAHLTRRFFYFIPKNGEPVKIVNSVESNHLDHLPGNKLKYNKHSLLTQHLNETLKNAKTIAMEYSPLNANPYISRVDAGTVEQVKALGVNVVTSGDLISLFTAVWTKEQYEDNISVANNLHKIVYECFNLIKYNILNKITIDEFDVQQFIMKWFEKLNYITDPPIIVGVNENSANPHYAPTKDNCKKINPGDFVLIDLWAKTKYEKAVWADITWVGFVGNSVPEKYKKIFDIVIEARDTAFNFVESRFNQRKEVRGYEVDDAARDVISKAGYGEYFIHRTGHSISLDLHGSGAHMDNYETKDERLILPSTSFSIEPGIYLPEFGVRSEIDVFITTEGKVIATGGERQKEIIPILK
jgi:Xaa-Pro dipeptidase